MKKFLLLSLLILILQNYISQTDNKGNIYNKDVSSIDHIIAEQFRRLRENDPHFYNRNINGIGSHFYRTEIAAASLARVIRENTNLLAENVPDNVFKV